MDQVHPSDSRLYFTPLTPDHRDGIQAFSCSVPDLEAFLKDDALRLHESHISFTYLAFLEHAQGGDELAGYISLIADALTLEQHERHDIPSIEFSVVPAVKVGRLATNLASKVHIRGTGTAMMRFAFLKGLELATIVGARFLTVDALEGAVSFYERLGFVKNTARTYIKKKQFISMRLDLFGSRLPGGVAPLAA